jgi:hypothetical protein
MGKIFNLDSVVLNWPQIFTAKGSKKFPTNPPKYSVVCMIEANSLNHHAVVNAMNEIAAESFPDGNCKYPDMAPSTDGKYIEIRASANADNPPGVLDGSKNEILNPSEIYSGVVCNVALDVFASTNYGRVCVGLLGVQKVADGPRMDNRPDTSELFQPINVVNNLQPGAPTVGKLLG